MNGEVSAKRGRPSGVSLSPVLSCHEPGTPGNVLCPVRIGRVITENGQVWESIDPISAWNATEELLLAVWTRKPGMFRKVNN